MNTSASHFFDTTVFVQPAVLRVPFTTPAKTARQSTASQAPEMPASLWRHTLVECEVTRRHGLVTRSLCGLLGVLSLGSVAAAAWQMHALLSGNRLHDAISAFLR